MNIAELTALAKSAGFSSSSAAIAAAIAMAESSGNPNALGDSGTSYGLWQVHLPAHPEYASSNLYDPQTNAIAAYAISKQGTDFTPWSTYNSGAYRSYYVAPSAKGHAVALAVGIVLVAGAAAWAISLASSRRSRRWAYS